MRLISVVFISALSAFLFAGCNERITYPPLTADQISGETLAERIFVEEHYKEYPFWPGHEGVRRGQFHGEVYHRVYINPILHNALPQKSNTAPLGSIIVKESLDGSKAVVSLNVMVKTTGVNTTGNHWYWASFSKDRDVITAGTLERCIDCHSGVKDNDFIMIHKLDKDFDAESEKMRSKQYME